MTRRENRLLATSGNTRRLGRALDVSGKTRSGAFASKADLRPIMPTATHPIPAQLAADLSDTLARLRVARCVNDEQEIRVSQRRLDWLCDKLPRQGNMTDATA